MLPAEVRRPRTGAVVLCLDDLTRGGSFIVIGDLFQGFCLGDRRVEPLRGRVSGPAGQRHVPPKAMEVLLRLAAQPGDVWTREDLLNEVWGSGQGSQRALNHAVSLLRYALDDHADTPRYIQTLPKRGYRLLVEPVVSAPTQVEQPHDRAESHRHGFVTELKQRGVVETGVAYLVVGWLIIQVADATFEQLLLPVWLGTFVTVLIIAGFPIALLLAWFLDIVGGRARVDPQTGRPVKNFFSRTYVAVLGALLLASAGVYVYDRSIGLPAGDAAEHIASALETPAPVEPNSIAILKFLNIDGSEETEIFSSGLAEDLMSRLAKVPSLRVSARGDAFSLPQNASSADVRKRLRVRYYLEGSVRLTDRVLRVVIRLIDSESGFRVLSRSFSRDRTEFFKIQDEITNLTVANLRVVLPPETQTLLNEARENPDLDAYLLYRRGVEALNRPMTASSIEEALDWLERSLDVDPDFAAAHAGICRAYAQGFRETSEPTYMERAETSCAAAISKDPNLDVVHTALGSLYWETGRDRDAERAYQRALDIDADNVRALRGLADVYYRDGRLEEAEAMHRRAIGLQPGDWATYNTFGWFLYQNGRYAEAADQFRKVVAIDSNNMQGYSNLGAALMLSGNFAEAAPAFQRAIQIEPRRDIYTHLGLMYYYLGENEDAIAAYQKAIELASNDHLAWMSLGDALSFTKDRGATHAAFIKAEELAEVSLSVNPMEAGTMMDLAWIKAMLGKQDEARKAIARAREITPGDPYVHLITALISVRFGDSSTVYDELEQAIEAGYSRELLAVEPHLKSIWQDPRFQALTGQQVAENDPGR
jgi:tetratricopeptide (TPR) repeat protein/DNA-binding winged helix-turn-helix (wHTH) protein